MTYAVTLTEAERQALAAYGNVCKWDTSTKHRDGRTCSAIALVLAEAIMEVNEDGR